jgi:hypothetical protein
MKVDLISRDGAPVGGRWPVSADRFPFLPVTSPPTAFVGAETAGLAPTIAPASIEKPMYASVPMSQPLLDWAEFWYPISWKGVFIAGAITAIAACVTIAFLMLQLKTSSVREAESEWRAWRLQLQTVEAKKARSDALERIAALSNQTATLTKKNLYLEQAIQPRQLSRTQARDITKLWGQFSGRSVSLWSYEKEPESRALAEQIRNCLVGARVVTINYIGQAASPASPHVGVQIAGSDEHLVETLYAGIRTIGGLDATVVMLGEQEAADGVPAEIFVGMKPLARPR